LCLCAVPPYANNVWMMSNDTWNSSEAHVRCFAHSVFLLLGPSCSIVMFVFVAW
jgi:hypothetical protein